MDPKLTLAGALLRSGDESAWHCWHENPEDYFWEVCRFRANRCTEENPESADLCMPRHQPCFDAATELFGPEPT